MCHASLQLSNSAYRGVSLNHHLRLELVQGLSSTPSSSLPVASLWFKMSTLNLPAKCYEDKAVQTEDSGLAARDIDQTREKLDKDSSAVTGLAREDTISGTGPSKADSSHSSDFCIVDSEDLGDVQGASIMSSSRAYSNSLSYRTLKLPSARIVSLPETSSLYSARRTLESVTTRTVSNPERSCAHRQDTSYSVDPLDISTESDVFVSGSQVLTRTRVRVNAKDAPYTPSPPSSPDSVVIIADKSQLPRGFLRNKAAFESPAPAVGRGEEGILILLITLYMLTISLIGWVAWAKSPPRPIPALHGPLSLPYARCPS